MTANPFTTFPFSASGSNQTDRTMPVRLAETSNVKDFGALGDGTGALLNTRYGSLAAAQAVYPFVTNIATQSIDWAAAMAALYNNNVFLTTTASNQTASFTGSIASASFTGTVSGNNLTTSGASGTIAIGQTISGMGVTACQIVSGSGTSWVVNGSTQTVGPVAMTTNCVLIVVSSGFSGSIGTGSTSWLVGSGVNASEIVSQFSGSAGSFGTYVLDRNQNVASQAMLAVSSVLTFASVPASVAFLMEAHDTASDVLEGTAVNSTTSTTVTLNSVLGLVNSGELIQFYFQPRGTIYFPPGSYVVTQPIDFSLGIISPVFVGELGASTISGNFSDYIFSRDNPGAFSNGVFIDKLNIVNTNANGGGIRAGGIVGGCIKDCTITANRCINTFTPETAPYDGSSFLMSIENCNLSPGSNYAGSIGIATTAAGPITNCRIIGPSIGMEMAGGEANQNILGCYFEGCGTALLPGFDPSGGFDHAAFTVSGCWFKNNSIAIDNGVSSLLRFIGCRIEGADGQAPGGGNCQYGIKDGDAGSGNGAKLINSLIAGVTITGNYDIAGVYMQSNGNVVLNTIYAGVQCTNGSATPGAKAWSIDFLTNTGSTPYLPTFISCSGSGLPFIYDVVDLKGTNVGDCFNVNDGTNSLAWGATVTNTGTHTTHYKCRYNGSVFTVVGQ